MITVIDTLCGTGKTVYCIEYKRFIYIISVLLLCI